MPGEALQDKENINTNYNNQNRNNSTLLKDHQQEKSHQIINIKKRPPSTPLTPSLKNQNASKKNKINGNNTATNNSHKKNLNDILIGIINEDRKDNISSSSVTPNHQSKINNSNVETNENKGDSIHNVSNNNSIFVTNTQSNTPSDQKNMDSNNNNDASNAVDYFDVSSLQGNDTVIRYPQQEIIINSTDDKNSANNNNSRRTSVNKQKTQKKANSKSFNDEIDFELMKINYEINELVSSKKLKENSQLIQFLKLERMFENHYHK